MDVENGTYHDKKDEAIHEEGRHVPQRRASIALGEAAEIYGNIENAQGQLFPQPSSPFIHGTDIY